MDNLWGYRIAVRSNEKCRKSCIRASATKCFVYDSSYHEIIQFSHPFNEVFGMLDSRVADEIRANSTMLGHLFWNTHLYHNQTILGPAKLILTVREGISVLRASVHPLVSSIIQVLVPQVTVIRGEYSMFELEGSQSPEFLSCILSMNITYSQIPDSGVYEWSCKDPRFAFPQKLSDPRQDCDLTSIDGDFWNKSGLVQRKSQKEINDLLSLHMIPGTKLQPTEADPRMPVLLMFGSEEQRDGRKHHRWTLMVPNGWGSALWRSLIFAGARFGGLEERQAVDAEHGRPVFPNDYPSSAAYLPYSEKISKELEDKWNKRPPAKRINYSRLGIQQPFSIDLSLLGENRKICRLECTGRGVPEWNGGVFIDGQLIGFITTGFYSQTHGTGTAFATCAIQDLAVPIQDLTVPIQISISGFEGHNRPAIITKIYP
jgi:ribonuclease P/MRP protein subunit POP1